MRTPEEITAYYREKQDRDIFGFTGEVLLPYLPFELAKEWLKPEATAENWNAEPPLDRESVLAEMREYMEFAWGKVINHRGLRAGRSVEKMTAWLWLLENDEAVAFSNASENYPQYGAPVLKYICQRYEFPIADGEMVERMARGKPCEPGCDQGCGD